MDHKVKKELLLVPHFPVCNFQIVAPQPCLSECGFHETEKDTTYACRICLEVQGLGYSYPAGVRQISAAPVEGDLAGKLQQTYTNNFSSQNLS